VLRYPPDERNRMEKEAQLRITQGRAPLKRSMDEPDDVFEDLRAVWDGWWHLGAGRQVGMAIGGLSWGDMSRWCQDHGIEGQERLRWIRLLQAMDGVAVSHWNRKAGSKPPPKEPADANP